MIRNFKKKFFEIDNKDRFFFIVFSFFPLSLIIGNLVINSSIFLLSLIFLLNLKENKFYIKNSLIYLLLFFFVSLLINLIFSTNPTNSLPRVIKIFFIILLIIQTLRIFNKYKQHTLGNIFLIWSLIFVIVLIDCLFESIFGFNSFGFSSSMTGRVASFFGDELVVGAFVHGFALIFLSYLMIRNINNYLIIFSIFAIIIISFLIGERSNFIKTFTALIIFSSFAINLKLSHKILSFFILICLIFGILNFNQDYKYRYYSQIEQMIVAGDISKLYKNSQYGAHQNAAIKILYEFPTFGVGVKNFRHESNKTKYESADYKSTNVKQATHPHQAHLEILSETGIFGYLCFIIFIFGSLGLSLKNYIMNKNLFQLSAIIFIFTSLLPVLPSGSFLSTFTSGIFWINFSIMIGFCKVLKSKS